jgi:nucleotide-binding universal stress UspA family protein
MMVLPKIHFATATVAGAYPQTIHDAQEYLTSVVQMLCQDALVRSSLEVTSSVVQQSTVNAALVELVTAEANSQASYKTSLDVIAMATHGREGLERWLHSSVTEQVLDAGTFPVLVLHPEPIEAHVPQDTERTDIRSQ